ncbi:hypothetical protein BGZ58_005865 [Dissophora ornata]|nr:hypothetical protein BGZ58_005865 [Dissophora ornata]
MTTIARPALGPLNDPYNSHADHYSNSSQHSGLGQQSSSADKEMPQANKQQPSTKALAITSKATKGTPPPPLMGSAIVLVNDSAMHCFGGRLENRELTNCHFVLDVETGYWQTIQAPPRQANDNTGDGNTVKGATDPSALFSLSLTTDPVNSITSSLSEALSMPRPRYFHTLNAYGTSLILFGGMGPVQANKGGEDSDNEGDQSGQLGALDDLHVYDIVTQRWQQKHPAHNEHRPRARWAHLATILDHYLVVIGGTDTVKAYVQDACVLDLHTWEWVASIKNIGQCGSYRTIAATGPSLQSSSEPTPSSHSFPSVSASLPQISSNLSWPATESGPIDAMASISQVLSGLISAPSSVASSQSTKSEMESSREAVQSGARKTSERLKSGELTPAFKAGKDMPSIYLYSNYNFQNLQRELKVITPQYARSPASAPAFTLADKSHALERRGHELPAGLRFPQGHVYQNQLILTGTLIISGKAPTMAVYAYNLPLDKWERLDTDTILQTGSWNRTLLHPATGTLLVFGHRDSNSEVDYSSRIQHHNHIMMINLQAYGFYERPVPSFLPTAQDLGNDLLMQSGLNDMHVASATGTLFDANSTVLAARWPAFSTMLLSPPYVTPLILVMPVPDEVIPIFLHYLYTGALPQNTPITPGIADYLLILARRYQLNGLHALSMDVLHQGVVVNPIRIYSSALIAGELGLQARAVGLAMNAPPSHAKGSRVSSQNAGLTSGADSLSPPPPPPPTTRKRISSQAYILDSGLSRNYSNKVPPPSSRPPVPPEKRRGPWHQSRDSVSTDGGMMGDSLQQQYNPDASLASNDQQQQDAVYMSSPESQQQRNKMRSPHTQITNNHASAFVSQPMSFSNAASLASTYESSQLPPQGPVRGSSQQHFQTHQTYSSPLSAVQQMGLISSHQQSGYARGGPGGDGASSVYGLDDDGASMYSSAGGNDLRAQQAKRRLQMQMQMQMQFDIDQQQHQEYLRQQQFLMGQQRLRDDEIMMQQQLQQQQQQRFIMKQQQQQQMGGPDYGMTPTNSSKSMKSGYPSSHMTTESTAETVSSQMSVGSGSNSGKAASVKSSSSEKEKKKGMLKKMKPPKPVKSGAELMRSAGF